MPNYIYLCSCCSHLENRASVKRFFSLQLFNLGQSVGLLGRRSAPSQGRYVHRTTQTQNKRRQTCKPWVGFEPTIPVFERAKTFYALDRVVAVIGATQLPRRFNSDWNTECRELWSFHFSLNLHETSKLHVHLIILICRSSF
jgi:hypothetical protein